MPFQMLRWVSPIACSVLLSCSIVKKSPPPQAEVETQLRAIAETEKKVAEEGVNPNLGVKVTWTIESVEVRPQPQNEAQPYAGTVHFVVESKTPELDGYATERFEKSYDYVWDMESSAWVAQ